MKSLKGKNLFKKELKKTKLNVNLDKIRKNLNFMRLIEG